MLLKIGSRGNEVKELQEFLGIGADGIFGKGTAAAVKEFQKVNGLGLMVLWVLTWDCMGLLLIIQKDVHNGKWISIHRHFLPEGEYKSGITKKEYCFIHHTAGWQNPYNCIDNWGRDSRGAVCTEFVLGGPSIKGNNDTHDGEMVQRFRRSLRMALR